ncbi:uncharacterized protein N7458_006136, partial [Penicillium daleae]
IIDETTRGLLAQAIRNTFTSSSIDHNEEYIDSLISKVDNDILQAYLVSQDGNARETPLRTSVSDLRTPLASPPKGHTAFTIKAIALILFEYFVVNSAIVRYGHQTSIALTRTDPDKIRKYINEIAEYNYKQAVSIIQRDNTLVKIILKGTRLINHTKLPSAKGPADGFTVAEKATTRKFIEDARYGLSAQN